MFQEKGFTSFKEVVSDSRCPEGLNCIWAGEVTVVLGIQDSKLVGTIPWFS
jgi:hypothetical protein